MKNILCMEYQRLFRNKKLYLSMAVSMLIVVFHILLEIVPYSNHAYGEYPLSVFEKWIGGEQSSVFPKLYFLVIPLIMAIPYGGSLQEDLKSGYVKNICTRIGKGKYFAAKYIVTFTAGMFAVIPLILNFVISAMFLPAVIPQASSLFYTINARSMMGELFYQHPYVYLCLYLLIDMVFFGLLATVSLVVTFVSEYTYVAILSPFLLCVMLLAVTMISKFSMIAPTGFLEPSQRPEASGPVILIEGILILVAGGVYYYVGRKKELF